MRVVCHVQRAVMGARGGLLEWKADCWCPWACGDGGEYVLGWNICVRDLEWEQGERRASGDGVEETGL